MDEQYGDPVREAMSGGKQRVVQWGSILAMAAYGGLQLRAHRKARDLAAAQARTEAARVKWSPALDKQWLSKADLLDTADAWGAAAVYAPFEQDAADALTACEGRLRTLHPHAMARYDWLRGKGLDPLEAMTEAGPLFARDANVRDGAPAPTRAALTPGTGEEALLAPGEHGPSRTEWETARQQQAAHRYARTLADQSTTPDSELYTDLQTRTNLPEDAIARAVQARQAGQRPANAATLAAADHPHTAAQAVQAAQNMPAESAPGHRPTGTPTPQHRTGLTP